MFREPEETQVFETDCLEDTPTNSDEVNMDVQKGHGAKDNSEPLYSVNTPISVSEPNPLSSNIDSRYVLPTKTTSFA